MAAAGIVFVRYYQARVAVAGELQLLFHLAQQRRVDVAVRRAGRVRKEAVGQKEASRRQGLGPPCPANQHQLAVEASQAPVGNGEPAARPADASVPDARGPDQDGRYDAAHEADSLRALDGPVDGAADALAVLAGRKVELVAEEGDPERQQGQEEGVVALSGAQLEELRAQRRLEDEEVEVDHGRGARGVVQRIALLRVLWQDWGRAGVGLDGRRGHGGAFDNGVDLVGHCCDDLAADAAVRGGG